MQALNRSNRFAETLLAFKNFRLTFGTEGMSDRPYLIGAVLKALRNTGAARHATGFLQLLQLQPDNLHPIIQNAYGWCLFAHLKEISTHDYDNDDEHHADALLDLAAEDALPTPPDLRELFAAAGNLLRIMALTPADDYAKTLRHNLLRALLKCTKTCASKPWELLYSILHTIEPLNLDTAQEEMPPQKEGETPVKMASEWEDWYLGLSAAALQTGRHEECRQLCNTVLEIGKDRIAHPLKYHIWFRYRLAKSEAALGNHAEAIALYRGILRKKPEWFIQFSLAELLLNGGETSEALQRASAAALASVKPAFKGAVYVLLARILKELGEFRLAHNHLMLAIAVRNENGWGVPGTYTALFQALPDDTTTETPELQDVKGWIKHLTPFWQKHAPATRPIKKEKFSESRIIRILERTEAFVRGLVKTAEGKIAEFTLKAGHPLFHTAAPGVPFPCLIVANHKSNRLLAIYSSGKTTKIPLHLVKTA